MVKASGMVMKDAMASPGVTSGSCRAWLRDVVTSRAVYVFIITKIVMVKSKAGATPIPIVDKLFLSAAPDSSR